MTEQAAVPEARRPPAPEPGDPLYQARLAYFDKDGLLNRALGNPSLGKLKGGANHPVTLRSGWPAMGVVTTARGLAGFYRDLIAGGLVKSEMLDDAIRRRVRGPDRVLILESSFGLGYMRRSLTFPVPPGASATGFGHTGLGGSLGLGDVRNGLAMAYTMNRTDDSSPGNARCYRLASAVYESLA